MRIALCRVCVAAAFLCISGGLAVFGMVRAHQSGLYEMDMRVLRNRESLAHGAASWDPVINRVFGVWLNPVAGLVEDPANREPMAESLRTALMAPPAYVERVETIERIVPNEAEQARRIARLKQVRKGREEARAAGRPAGEGAPVHHGVEQAGESATDHARGSAGVDEAGLLRKRTGARIARCSCSRA